MRIKINCLLLSLLIYCIAFDRDFYEEEYNFKSIHCLIRPEVDADENNNNLIYNEHTLSSVNIIKPNLSVSLSGTIDFSFNHPVCNPKEITFVSSNLQLQSIVWDFGDG